MTAPLAYSIATACDATGLSESHINRAIRAGHLRARKTGVDANGDPVGKWLIRAADLEAYIDSLPEA